MIRRVRGRDEHGQILIIVSVAFVGLLAMLALLFDAANALVMRRQLQDAADAAALSAANVVQVGSPRGCSATAGGSTPRTTLVDAAKASLASNVPWYDTSTAVITCPGGYQNQAVAVAVDAEAPKFFGGIVGGELHVSARAAAVNGQLIDNNYSVVILDPHNPTWPAARRGCPAFRVSGQPTLVFEGSVQVNSACSQADGGALATDGNQASITMNNGSLVHIVGEANDPHFLFSPAPLEGVDPLPDPLAGLPPVDTSAMTVRSNTKLTITGPLTVLYPGIYRGGVTIEGSGIVLLQPGIYIINGGGLSIAGSAKVLSVNNGVTTSSLATWEADCSPSNCGVLIYNRQGTSTAMGPVTVAGGAVLRLRPYNPDAVANGVPEYRNLLIWQDAAPAPTAAYAQPEMQLHGHGDNRLLGTVYAPSASVRIGGGTNGSGGSPVTQRLQFISWNLIVHGSPSFTFQYQAGSFVRPTDYGLVE